MAFDYPETFRPDIGEAHRAYWNKLKSPGNWWRPAQRIAIAAASREAIDCDLCRQRRAALSPESVQGEHHNQQDLSATAVDVVHRIVTDQTRISAAYIEANESDGLSKPAYVELVGVVVAVLSIDEFHRAMGLSLESLPAPGPGEPDGYLPGQAVSGTGFIQMIPADGASGKEVDLWPADRTANVLRALSLVPDAVRSWLALSDAQYLSMQGMGDFDQPEGRCLNRMQIELIAGRVSAMNECFY